MALQTVLGTISPDSKWAARLNDLLGEFNAVPSSPGIPEGLAKRMHSGSDTFTRTHRPGRFVECGVPVFASR